MGNKRKLVLKKGLEYDILIKEKGGGVVVFKDEIKGRVVEKVIEVIKNE